MNFILCINVGAFDYRTVHVCVCVCIGFIQKPEIKLNLWCMIQIMLTRIVIYNQMYFLVFAT